MLWISSLNINKIKHFERILARWVNTSYFFTIDLPGKYINCPPTDLDSFEMMYFVNIL